MPSESTPIQARTVFVQDTQPADTDVLWIDTSADPSELNIYDETIPGWRPVAQVAWGDVSNIPAILYPGDVLTTPGWSNAETSVFGPGSTTGTVWTGSEWSDRVRANVFNDTPNARDFTLSVTCEKAANSGDVTKSIAANSTENVTYSPPENAVVTAISVDDENMYDNSDHEVFIREPSAVQSIQDRFPVGKE